MDITVTNLKTFKNYTDILTMSNYNEAQNVFTLTKLVGWK